MPDVDEPLHRLPDRVVLDRGQVYLLLRVSDALADSTGVGSRKHREARAGVRLLTRLLWEELADILDADPEEGT